MGKRRSPLCLSDWELDELVSLVESHWSYVSLGAWYGTSPDSIRRIYKREKQRRACEGRPSTVKTEVA